MLSFRQVTFHLFLHLHPGLYARINPDVDFLDGVMSGDGRQRSGGHKVLALGEAFARESQAQASHIAAQQGLNYLTFMVSI